MPHMRRLRTSVNQTNAEQIDSLIQDSCHITVHELARIVVIRVFSVETIVHDELNFSEVNTHWVLNLLSDEQRKDEFRFKLSSWMFLKVKVTHLCI